MEDSVAKEILQAVVKDYNNWVRKAGFQYNSTRNFFELRGIVYNKMKQRIAQESWKRQGVSFPKLDVDELHPAFSQECHLVRLCFSGNYAWSEADTKTFHGRMNDIFDSLDYTVYPDESYDAINDIVNSVKNFKV